jgi:hypothetical protein
VALAGAHPGEQALTSAVTGGGLAAARFRLAASGLAALAAEQTGRRFLILTQHGETNQGHQHGDRRQNNTIHLQTPPNE